MADWIMLKAHAVRLLGLVGLVMLAYLFARGYALCHNSDRSFSLAWAAFAIGVLWALLAVTIAGLDESYNLLKCTDLRPIILRHVEIVWGPLVVASYWLLAVLIAGRP